MLPLLECQKQWNVCKKVCSTPILWLYVCFLVFAFSLTIGKCYKSIMWEVVLTKQVSEPIDA